MKSPLETNTEFCTLLGRISAQWSMIELALESIVADLIGSDQNARAVYSATASFRQKVEMLKALTKVQFSDEDERDYVIKVLARLYDAFKARNKLIHQPYLLQFNTDDGEDWLYESAPDEHDASFRKANKSKLVVMTECGERKINKGEFLNHLKKLQGLINEIKNISLNISTQQVSLLGWDTPTQRAERVLQHPDTPKITPAPLPIQKAR